MDTQKLYFVILTKNRQFFVGSKYCSQDDMEKGFRIDGHWVESYQLCDTRTEAEEILQSCQKELGLAVDARPKLIPQDNLH